MNRHLVFISWKRSIEVVLLIVTMESFNNSIVLGKFLYSKLNVYLK